MKRMRIPHADIEASALAIGCMGLGGRWKKGPLLPEHEAEAHAFLDTALEIGANFFDHANIYAFGRAEEVFGRVLKGRPSLRDQIVLQSKCGIRWSDDPPGAPQRFDFSHDHILASVEGILRRLGTDRLDILLLHRPDVLWEGEEVARAFAGLKRAGKVRYFGVSNQNRFQMEYLQSFLPDPLVANQLEMNLLHHGFAEVGISVNQASPRYPDGWEGLTEYCRLKGVLMQAWSPVARGLLSGGSLDGQPPAVAQTARAVQELATQRGVSREAIVLAWLLKHPAGIQPVLGTTRPDRLRACAEAFRVELSREEWYQLFATARGESMP
ncbi:MAG TPA: aldo/keto reductase [Anaeromyxobacter sp.]|nr:aldo/keto reductase [Anaeromyxobacter sp.]